MFGGKDSPHPYFRFKIFRSDNVLFDEVAADHFTVHGRIVTFTTYASPHYAVALGDGWRVKRAEDEPES